MSQPRLPSNLGSSRRGSREACPLLHELLRRYRGRGLHGVPEAEWDAYVARRVAEIEDGVGGAAGVASPDGRVLRVRGRGAPGRRADAHLLRPDPPQADRGGAARAKEQAEVASQAKSDSWPR